MLIKKLEIINCYYIPQSCVCCEIPHQNFGWLRSEGGEDRHRYGVILHVRHFGPTSRKKTMEKLKELVLDLLFERKKEFVRSLKRGKKSLIQWLKDDEDIGGWKTLNVVKIEADEVGILLSRYVCDFLFVFSESESIMEKYRMYLKTLLDLLIVNGWSIVVINRIVEVLEFAEGELIKIGKLNREEKERRRISDEEILDQREIDRVLDMFLGEILCLESIFSYPNLPNMYYPMQEELKASVLSSLADFNRKEVEKIGSKMAIWKAMHQFCQESDVEMMKMDEFQKAMELQINEAWKELMADPELCLPRPPAREDKWTERFVKTLQVDILVERAIKVWLSCFGFDERF